MTRLYISADLEGALGVTSPLQCSPKGDAEGYRQAVSQLGKEVSAIIHAALQADDTIQIIVNDAHFGMTNLSLPDVGNRVQLLSGKPKPCAMTAGLTSQIDGLMLIGYHAKAGTEKGILNHTFHSKLWDVSVNGVSYGEGGINALYASLIHQVPVVLASGDAAFCQEITGLIPNLSTVQTKTALSTTAAMNRPECDVLNDYSQRTQTLLHDKNTHADCWKKNILNLQGPYTLQMTFTDSYAADCAAMQQSVRRLDGRTLTYTTADFEDLYLTLQASYALISYTSYLGV